MKYYLITFSPLNGYHGPFLVRSETSKLFEPHYIYDSVLELWIEDIFCITNDHLVGYDPAEDIGYRLHNDYVYREMKEITLNEVNKIIKSKTYTFTIFKFSKYIELLRKLTKN